jgi:hypothetical protein
MPDRRGWIWSNKQANRSTFKLQLLNFITRMQHPIHLEQINQICDLLPSNRAGASRSSSSNLQASAYHYLTSGLIQP